MTEDEELRLLKFRERALALRLRQLRGELPMDGEISIRELAAALGMSKSEAHRVERIGLLKARKAAQDLHLHTHLPSA